MRLKGQYLAICIVFYGAAVCAQDTTYTLYGTPGLIEMPTAQSAPDAEISASIGLFQQQQRVNFTFQVTPRLSGTFRYAGIAEDTGIGTDGTYDRSFDLRYRIFDEAQFGSWSPSIAIGLQDFLGTGRLSSEYIVASKSFQDTIIGTVGLGWGRFGTEGGITNPLGALDPRFETRPTRTSDDNGGKIAPDKFFRGDVALFGGISWQYSDKITLKAEYSSDAYVRENILGTLESRSPVNVGLSYHYSPDVTLDAAYLYGSELAASVTLALNPSRRAFISGREIAPYPIRVRGASSTAAASWDSAQPEQTLEALLESDGFRLLGQVTNRDTTRLRYVNTTYRSEAQGLGRVARIMTQTLPDTVATFVLEPTQAGIPLSRATLRRSDLERFENTANAADDILSQSVISDAGRAAPLPPIIHDEPALKWGVSPYAALTIFNVNAPLQIDYGLQFNGTYELAPNLVVSGSIQQSFRGARDPADATETPNSFHNVRTDGDQYGIDGNPTLTSLNVAHYSRPGTDLYGRVTVGYLERMYGGVSSEILWKPVDSPLAIGAEVNYAKQRDFDLGFGFQDYDIVTGHLNAYYSFDNGFHAQLGAGRYLAGDWGTTFALDREFDNGWKVGAYFTLTDMPFDEFGEGSFDKGIRVTVPTDFFLGNASRDKVSRNLASLTRDGGARLAIDGRLYDVVRGGHVAGQLGDTWGRFWR